MKERVITWIKKVPVVQKLLLKSRSGRRHKPTQDLLNNLSVPLSDHTSIIHFSINKAATQYVKRVLSQICKENRIIHIDFNGYAFASNLPYLDLLSFDEMEAYKHIFKPKGYLYSVFGGFVKNIDNIGSYKIVLSIRDPRDILVSKYYSIRYSHPVPPQESDKQKRFLKKRTFAKYAGINDFVLKECDLVLNVYEQYMEELLNGKNNVGIVRYERMISDYDGWLQELTDYCGLPVSEGLKSKLIEEFERKQVNNEDKNRHLRKGRAGDYQEKLKPATIRTINERLRKVLDFFDYK